MARRDATITKAKLLIVEGKDEEGFFRAAMSQFLLIADIQILPIGGKQQLYSSLRALMLDPLFTAVTSLGIVRDADSTAPGSASPAAASAAEAAFMSIAGVLTSLALPCPTAHALFTTGTPRVGAFVMPDGVNDGMLETLCMNSVIAQTGPSCVDGFFDCVKSAGVTLPKNLQKARAHAWLACQPEPGKRVGEAADAGYWNWADPAFAELWSFLRAM